MAKHPQAISRYLQHSDHLSNLHARLREDVRLLREIRQEFACEISIHITAVRRDGQVLTLYVDAPVWASRIRYLSDAMAAKADASEVRIRVSPPPVQPEKQRTDRDRPRHSNEAANHLSRTADSTSDEKLKAVLLRLSHAVRQ